MSYLWNEFNIKTFPAETIVWRDGAYCPDLSTIDASDINRNYDLPVHIIYIGEIAGKNELNINLAAENQPLFLSVDIKIKKPAFLNIFIKNTGKNSEIRGHVMIENLSEFNYDCTALHGQKNTAILIKNKVLAGKNSISKLSASAIIEKDCPECISDIGFSALADKTSKIKFTPAQRISSVPQSADHSASIYRPTEFQIQYLRGAGLSGAETDIALREAFMKDFPLF